MKHSKCSSISAKVDVWWASFHTSPNSKNESTCVWKSFQAEKVPQPDSYGPLRDYSPLRDVMADDLIEMVKAEPHLDNRCSLRSGLSG